MKLLRVLTGVHAGASLQLSPGTHRIGQDDDADIRLSDWQGADATLEVDASDVIRITRHARPPAAAAMAESKTNADSESDSETEAGTVLLVDFVPMQFGETVLCVGPEDMAWPADVDLLSTLLASPVKSELASYQREQRRRRQWVAGIACVALSGVIIAGALLGMTQTSRAAFAPNAEDHGARIGQALAAAHIHGLMVLTRGNTVVITGMVATTGDDNAVRAILERLNANGVERRYDVAQDDIRSIHDSLGIAGTNVAYRGEGRFVVTGQVDDPQRLSAAVSRVRSDLDANVKALDIEARSAIAPPDAPQTSYSEMVSSDDVRYAETPDGVKHIFAVDPALSARAASGASATATSAADTSNAASGVDATTVDKAARTQDAANVAETAMPMVPLPRN